MKTNYNLFGEQDITPPEEYFSQEQKKLWYDKFVEWANDEYLKFSSEQGRFTCSYEWCCDECEMEVMDGCKDCVNTIISILKNNNINIDYSDYDFKKYEKQAVKLYEQ